jgi:regulator of replication initiation timing
LLDSELQAAREQIKALITEKHSLDTKLHNTERLSSQLQADLDYQIHTLRGNLKSMTEDNRELKEQEEELRGELEQLTRARDNFKQ